MSEEALPMRRWIFAGAAVVALVVVAVVFAGGGLSSGSGSGTGATPLPTVPPADRIVADARAVPARWTTVAATVPASVVRVAVAEGDQVISGAVLVVLDDEAARAEAATAQAGLDAARARALQATAGVAQAAAEVDRATQVWRAARALRNQLPGNASNARKRQGDAEVAAALAGADAAKAARDGAAAARTVANADVARATATLDAANAAVTRLMVSAPMPGIVAAVAVADGDVVAAGTPLVRIAGSDGWTFETTDLTQDEVGLISLGSTATVIVDGLRGPPIPGRITRIASYGVDRQGDVVFTAAIEPTGPVPPGVRWNMTASVEIAIGP